MKAATQTLKDYLASHKRYVFCELYAFTLAGGTVLYYTDADIDIVLAGNTYLHGELVLSRSKVTLKTGLQVSTLTITAGVSATATLGGVPLLRTIVNGALDGASVTVERLFMPTWGDTSLGPINIFTGAVADVTVDGLSARIEVQDGLRNLQGTFPRNYWQPGCNNALFDSACTLLKADFEIAGTVGAGSTRTSIATALTQADGWFAQGSIVFDSGANTGVERTVKSYASGAIELIYPLVEACAVGDAFRAYPGCDHTRQTCDTKFHNLAHFRGMPDVPHPNTITLGMGTHAPVTDKGAGVGNHPGGVPTGRGGGNDAPV